MVGRSCAPPIQPSGPLSCCPAMGLAPCPSRRWPLPRVGAKCASPRAMLWPVIVQPTGSEWVQGAPSAPGRRQYAAISIESNRLISRSAGPSRGIQIPKCNGRAKPFTAPALSCDEHRTRWRERTPTDIDRVAESPPPTGTASVGRANGRVAAPRETLGHRLREHSLAGTAVPVRRLRTTRFHVN